MTDPYQIIIAPDAARDLVEIHAYIATDSAENAARLVERILKSIELLKTVPGRNVLEHQSRKVKHPVRSLPVGSYLVYFGSWNASTRCAS
jgi:plasmid stabilization system protein ParE